MSAGWTLAGARRSGAASVTPAAVWRLTRSTSPSAKRATGVAAEKAEREGSLAAEIVRHVETVTDREIGAQARTLDGTEAEGLPGFDAERRDDKPRACRRASPACCAPVSAMMAAVLKRSDGPWTVSSRPAAVSGLPTRRLARRKERPSIGPEGGTPTSQ